MNVSPTGIGWFDAITVVALIVGIKMGRGKGMSVELLPMAQWLTTVIVCGKYYATLGQPIANSLHVSLPAAYPLAYIALAIGVAIVFVFLRKTVGEKLSGTDIFGRLEFYLGMLAGAIKFACFLIAALALLNSKYISEEQRAADAKAEKETYGNSFFPSVASIQQDIFAHSLSGRFVKQRLAFTLIQPLSTPYVEPAKKAGTKKNDLDDVLGNQPAKK